MIVEKFVSWVVDGFLLLFFLMLLPSTTYSQIYKWVDENGKVHFSDKEIKTVEQEVVSLKKHTSYWTQFDIQVKAVDVKITEQEHQNIIDGVNYVYEFYDRVLSFDIYQTIPVKVLLLKDKDAYRTHLKSKGWGHLGASYGVYLPKENQIVVYMREDRQLTFKTIKHEVSHAVVDTIMPYAPAWLNEGLAEQMETIGRNEQGLYIEQHDRNRSLVAYANKRQRLIEIDELLKLPSGKWRHTLSTGGNALQAQAGQFLYFLLSKPTRRNFVVRLMHNFDRGDRTLSYYLVDDNYIGGVAMLKLDWGNWLYKQGEPLIQLY